MNERKQVADKAMRWRGGPWRAVCAPLAAGCLAAGMFAARVAQIPCNKESALEEGLLMLALWGVLGLAVLPWGFGEAFRGRGPGRRQAAAALFVVAACAGLAFGVPRAVFRVRYDAVRERPIRTVEELVGMDLCDTARVARRLPEGDRSTPEAAMMGRLRAMVAGTFREQLTYETGEAREETLHGGDANDLGELAAEDLDKRVSLQELGFVQVSVTRVERHDEGENAEFTLHARSVTREGRVCNEWSKTTLVPINGEWKVARDENGRSWEPTGD